MSYQEAGQDRPADNDVVRFGTTQRRRRPWIPGVLVAVAAGAVIAVAVSSSGHHAHGKHARHVRPGAPPVVVTEVGHPLLGVTSGWELFARGFQYVVSIEPSTGRVTRTVVPPLESNNPEVAFLVGPHGVIVRSFDQVPGYSVPNGKPAALLTGTLAADSPGPLLPGPQPGQAWVLVGPEGHQSLALTGLDGRLTGTSVRLPPDGPQPQTAVSDGRGNVLLLTSANRLYDAGPTSYRRVPSEVLAVGPKRWLALVCAKKTCRNVVLDAATGARRTLPGPGIRDSAFSYPPPGVTAPDGSIAAVPAFAASRTGGSVRVRLINLRTGAGKLLAVRMNPAPGYQIMTWSPDSRWLFVVASGGKLVAINARTGQARSLRIPLPAISQVAIRNAPG